MSFEAQVVVVTGGSSGIGRATAVAFAREGARVVMMRGRILGPEQIAEVVVWRCSAPERTAINGSVVMADDGFASFK